MTESKNHKEKTEQNGCKQTNMRFNKIKKETQREETEALWAQDVK